MDNILDDPSIKNQLVKRLQDVGFDMKNWIINFYHACEENHRYKVGDDYYESCDYIYLINKSDPKDVFSLWIDVAWTEGMEKPIIFILYLDAELTVSPVKVPDKDISEHFTKRYLESGESKEITNSLTKKYSIKPLPDYKDLIREEVTRDQFTAIMKQPYFQRQEHIASEIGT